MSHSDRPSHGRRSQWVAVAGACVAVAVTGCAGGARMPHVRTPARRTATPLSAAGGLRGGYSPQTLQRAYGVSPLLRKGINGRGETVVLPEFAIVTLFNIRQVLTTFDTRDHLPRVDLTIGRALGYTGPISMANGEEVEDAEIVHAIAPGAKITIMLSGRHTSGPGHLPPLLRAAAERGNIVSYSDDEPERDFSAGQLRSLNRALNYARDRHVTMVASAGDHGVATGTKWGSNPPRGVSLPASSPLVTAVGGTTLTVRHDGAYASESAWDEDHGQPLSTGAQLSATGGGVSARYPRPAYQHGLPVIGGHRGVPDVAAVADPGIAVVVVHDGHETTAPAGGTSASAPLWAGIAALADQNAHRQLGFLNEGLYRIGHSTQYHHAFHDITHGDNTVTLPSGTQINGYPTRPGWDPVTGWGSPNAQVLVPLLATDVHPNDGQGR
jgi:subtilase family serine protease